MKSFRLIGSLPLALLLLGCGGGSNGSPALEGKYGGTFSEATPNPGAATGTLDLTIAPDGTASGSATDSRYAGTGTIASGSSVARNGATILIVTYSAPSSALTTMRGTLVRSGITGISGILTEDNDGASGPTFTYALTRMAD